MGQIDKSIVMPAFFRNTVNDAYFLIEMLKQVKKDRWYNVVEFYFEGDEKQFLDIGNVLRNYGFDSVFLAGIPLKVNKLNLSSLVAEERGYAIKRVMEWIDRAYSFNSKKLLISSGVGYGSAEGNMKAKEALINSIVLLCRYADHSADDYILDITLEYFNDQGEPWFLIGPSKDALELAKQVSAYCRNFELTFDLSHAVQLRENPFESFTSIMQYVNHIHIANCVITDSSNIFYGDRHPPIGLQGGEVEEDDVCRFIMQVMQAGYFDIKGKNKIVGIEVICPDDMRLMEVYNDASGILSRAFQVKDSEAGCESFIKAKRLII